MIVKFKEIATLVAGQSPESKYYSFENGVPFLQGNRTFGQLYPKIDTYTSKVTKIAPKGGILMSVRAPVGDLNLAPLDVCIGRGLSYIKSKNNEDDFLYYALKYNINNLKKQGNGTTYDSVSKDIIENLDMIIPDDKFERNKIGKFFRNIDNQINNNNEQIKVYLDIVNLIYDYWFLQFEFPNVNNNPYKSNGGEFKHNDVLDIDIPSKWNVKKLKDCVSSEKNAVVDGPFGTQMKIEDYVLSGIPVYEMEQLNNLFIVDECKHYISKEKFETVKRSSVKNGDIIISKTGTLGLLGIVNSKYEKGVIVSRLAKITPDDSIIGKYTLLIILSHLNKSGYWDKKSTGSTMPILNIDIINNIDILLPDNDLYVKFEEIISPIFEKIKLLQEKNIEYGKLIERYLPLLMNGQIKIKEVE